MNAQVIREFPEFQFVLYDARTRENGEPFDPWIRIHTRRCAPAGTEPTRDGG
jgi:hypothetical protein